MSRVSIILYSLFFIQSVMAEPTVLYDAGSTIPVYPYKVPLEGIVIPDFGESWAKQTAEAVDQSDDPADPANWLPVSTTRLTPGDFKARAVTFNGLASPVCIIGSDDRSIEWIVKYHDALLENNVLCWLVSAQTIADVQRVVNALNGISMSPANGDSIAEFFTIDRYPVLITQRFIEQ